MITHDEWHQKANDRFKELEILDGPNYKVEKTLAGRRIHMRIPQVEESSGGGSYSGPFALDLYDATQIQMSGYTSDNATSIDSYILIDTGTGRSNIVINETLLTPTYAKPYICADWWYNSVTNGWIGIVIASAAMYPDLSEYTGYPAEIERVSRRVIGKAKFTYKDDVWSLSGVEQWFYGIIEVSLRTY